ncbi:MAG: DUF169 domain-containing protein [Deltaproteobacteria bacterium]|nr:DUF169 domain-containing protein [Deltaproteobacteria bacterium]
MSASAKKLSETLNKQIHLTTLPVGVKLARKGDTAPEKIRYPLQDLGHRLTVCQGMTAVRTLGWTVGFKKEDHGCPLPNVFLGLVAPDIFLEGAIAGPYQNDPEFAKVMEATYPRWPFGEPREVWLSPLGKWEQAPDLAVIYGNPAQILSLIQAANFGKGTGLKSASTGRLGCSLWLAGVVQTGESTYMVPGPGERVFAGTQDHEMTFAIPFRDFERITEGLEYIGRKGAYRYPVPNLSALSEPKIPRDYFQIDSGQPST